MAQKPKLTKQQWDKLLDEHFIDKVGIRELSRRHKVSDTAIRNEIKRRHGLQSSQINDAANQMVAAIEKVESLPYGS